MKAKMQTRITTATFAVGLALALALTTSARAQAVRYDAQPNGSSMKIDKAR